MILSIIVPVFNEKETIIPLIDKILKAKISLEKQIIVVDDFSTDGSLEIINDNFKNYKEITILSHKKNQGKGAAINTARKYINGEIIIIQDADLEYDPSDYANLVEPIINQNYEVVYGSRVLGKKRYSLKNFTSIYRIFFNHSLTILSNFLNNQKLTDAHTCYKVIHENIFKKIELEEKRFGFCPEVTTKIGNLKVKIFEVPINYYGRNYKQGKKISMKDGLRAIYCLFKYRFLS
ncbi:MAG: glycosyl transferase [Alphaproteobacteria bacterium]|nr:glycosyl transferase [Alphaproteobacteria bacterium]|tara:strand:- start:155 stop:859 length:705 start_codon:yes stop_codon:yes gene_type:complete